VFIQYLWPISPMQCFYGAIIMSAPYRIWGRRGQVKSSQVRVDR